MELKQHPLSAAFPAMSDADFAALVDDVRRHGQREPIMIFEDMVLDGWHRYRACVECGIVPTKFKFDGPDPVAFVLSHNLHRRHLSASQRAAAVVACSEWAPARRPNKVETISTLPKTNAEMAKAAQVTPRTITDAKAAHKAGLSEPVKSGAMTAHEAAAVARGKTAGPKKTQLAPSPAPAPRGQTLPTKAESPTPAPTDDFDPVAELEKAHAEIQKLTEEIKAAEADDLKREAIKWRRAYEHAERQQAEAMDRATKERRMHERKHKELMRCGKAVGETDPDKVVAAVLAFVRKHSEVTA